MEIKWLGHSCFRIRGKSTTVVTDPYPPGLGYSLGKPTADITTVSNQQPGHSYTAGVGGNPRRVTGPGEYEISDVIIIGLATFHDGQHKGKNTVYLMELDDLSVCHLGNLGSILSDDQVEELGITALGSSWRTISAAAVASTVAPPPTGTSSTSTLPNSSTWSSLSTLPRLPKWQTESSSNSIR